MQTHLGTLNQSLACVTRERLSFRAPQSPKFDTAYAIALRNTDAVVLQGEVRLVLVARQLVGVGSVRANQPAVEVPYRAEVVGYFYQISTPDNRELLAFHWTPDATDPNTVTFAHLHIGPAIVGGQTTIRPRDLHKAHIPTGVISLAAVIRLAIAEFGVAPLRSDWDRVLRRVEDAERDDRRRG